MLLYHFLLKSPWNRENTNEIILTTTKETGAGMIKK